VDKFLPILLVFGAALAVAALIHYVTARAERQRTEAMKAVADGFGFDFQPHPDAALLDDVRGLPLFGRGRKPRLRNMMWGTTRDLGVAVFDYAYTTGSGKSQQTHSQTVVRFLAADLALPAFALRPESFWHRVGQLFGAADIDFDTHPAFSKQYLLRGEDEAAVRAAFQDDVLEYFEDCPGLCVEAAGPRIVIYRAGARVEPTAVRAQLEQGFEVLAAFRPAATNKPPAPDVE
jgi:hypothetical protein